MSSRSPDGGDDSVASTALILSLSYSTLVVLSPLM